MSMAGCASNVKPDTPRIKEQSTPLRAPTTPFRIVRAGDTLYSIAWEIGRDYRDLAKWNDIESPYVIKPGQRLNLMPTSRNAGDRINRADDAPSESPKPGIAVAKPAESIQGKPIPPTVKSAAKAVSPGTQKNKSAPPPESSRRAAAKTDKSLVRQRTASAGKWSWPVDGRVANRQKDRGQKGLDIRGTRGEPVRAASDGRVVYLGSGLRGYGQLIIIKHNDEFLSAYAHNDRIHVKEGETVRRGQKIADMGSTGTDRVKLHFEIRRHGAPVDPLTYLPKR